MTTKQRTAGVPAWRVPSPRSWARPPGFALLGLALIGLIQTGCKSDGCSTCGFGTKISNGVQSLKDKVFHHKKGCGGGCGGECVGPEGGIDSGMPIGAPGGMIVPAPGTIIPAPATESAPTQLEAIPSNSSSGANANPASGRAAPGGNTRSAYTTMLPRNGTTSRRGTDVSRALLSSPEPGSRSLATATGSGTGDLLDNLPPVDLPAEVTRKAVPPAASATPPIAPPGPAASPSPASASSSPAAAAADTAAPPPAEKTSAAEGPITSIPPINAVSAHQAPGIRRYSSVAPTVGGGSAPSIDGLDWLKEKGCRTLIDLRQRPEVEPFFIDAVNDRGMVYISLPIMANRLDPSRLARFDDLVSRTENRPLFFCDVDGTRAGLVWYIHLRTVNQEDPQEAAAKAEEIGLTDAQAKIAEQYLATHRPRAKTAMASATASASGSTAGAGSAVTPPLAPLLLPEPEEPPVASAPPVPTSRPVPTRTPVESTGSILAPNEGPTPSMLPGEHRPQASATSGSFRDPASWKPVAALVLTGIGIPLAYWSRSAISEVRPFRKRARASLPAAERRALDAPDGLDA